LFGLAFARIYPNPALKPGPLKNRKNLRAKYFRRTPNYKLPTPIASTPNSHHDALPILSFLREGHLNVFYQANVGDGKERSSRRKFLLLLDWRRGVCEDLAEQLASNGWTVYTTSLKKKPASRLVDIVTTVWRLRRDYGVAHVDVYSGAAFIWAEAACWALRRIKKPYVLTLHGGDLPEFSRRWQGRVIRLLRSAAVVTSPSRYLRDQMKSYREDLQLMPNPLDLKQYRSVFVRRLSRIFSGCEPFTQFITLRWRRE
jgi:hypothetical protein